MLDIADCRDFFRHYKTDAKIRKALKSLPHADFIEAANGANALAHGVASLRGCNPAGVK